MSDLAGKTCVPCRGGVPPLAGKELKTFAARCRPGKWSMVTILPVSLSFRISSGARVCKQSWRAGRSSRAITRIFFSPGAAPPLLCGPTKLTASPKAISSWPQKLTGCDRRAFHGARSASAVSPSRIVRRIPEFQTRRGWRGSCVGSKALEVFRLATFRCNDGNNASKFDTRPTCFSSTHSVL